MKVITFSLFGDNPLYCEGAVENAKLAKEIYPDWICAFFVSDDVPKECIDRLTAEDAAVFLCERKNKFDGLNWRFMPFADPNVKVWISRDCDSRLSWRERAAVDEWLETDKACHLMRDSHNHSYTMMAGMFGINNELFFERYGMLNLQNPGSANREDDQTILERAVWPLIQNDHVCHDHWNNTEPSGECTTQEGDHVDHDKAYGGCGVKAYVMTEAKNHHPQIYPEGQDNRPFPEHKPMDHGIFVGQIIEVDGTPRMNTDVRWEYELRGIDHE